jgi:hypothetical protein
MSDQWHGGKGSKYRKVDAQKFADNWDAIFGKNKDINSTSDNEDVLDGDKEETQTERETDP